MDDQKARAARNDVIRPLLCDNPEARRSSEAVATHDMTQFLEAFEGYFRPPDERFATIFELEAIAPSSALALQRLKQLSFATLTLSGYYVAVMIVESSAEFVGSAGLAILECIIMRQTSIFPTRGRSLAHVSHMARAFTMFLSLTIAKGFAILYSTYDACKMPSEALGELECSHLRWVSTCVVAINGYFVYVAMLVFSRLCEDYTLILASRRIERTTSKTCDDGVV